MAIRRVSSLEELDLPNKYIYQGNNGYIYNFKDKYFKVLDEEYMSLDNRNNQGRLDILGRLSELENTKYLVLPEDIYVTDSKILGYTMRICPGKEFIYLDDNVSYDKLVLGIINLLFDIEILSNKGLLDLDICSSNIFFDGVNLYLLDFDGTIRFDDKRKAYLLMGMSLINLCIGKIMDSDRLEWFKDIDIDYMWEKMNRLESSNYIGLLWLIKLKMSRALGKDVETLGDIRRVLRR